MSKLIQHVLVGPRLSLQTNHIEKELLKGDKPDDELTGAHNVERKAVRDRVVTHVHKYSRPQWVPALWNLASTAVLHVLVCYFAYRKTSMDLAYVGLILFAAMLRVRTFVLMHDMAHLSYFPSRLANNCVGIILSGCVFTPFSAWQRSHNLHHSHSNKADMPQFGQTAPWTVEKYQKSSLLEKLLYRVIFGPITLFVITPMLLFFMYYRLISKWWEHCITAFMAIVVPWYFGGWSAVVAVEIPTVALAALGGVFLFHTQHTFEGVYRVEAEKWTNFDNAMQGSLFLQVPSFLTYFTAGIQYHHIHHLSTRVPLYRLRECHEDAMKIEYTTEEVHTNKKGVTETKTVTKKGLFADVPALGVMECITATLRYSLWSAANGKAQFHSLCGLNVCD